MPRPPNLAELERDLLQGAVDLHVHTSPCPFPRRFDDAEAAAAARDLGLRAIVVKDHHQPTAGRVHHARKLAPGIDLLGSVVLNTYLGGLNPHAAEAAVRFYGARVVWLPTVTSAAHLAHFGQPGFSSYKMAFRAVEGISALRDGRLAPEIKEIIQICREHDVCLGTGHLSMPEIRAVLAEAQAQGFRKLLITHPLFVVPDLSLEEQLEIAGHEGVFLEYTFLPMMPIWKRSAQETAAAIRAVGPKKCVLASDLGNYLTPSPAEGFRCFVQTMLHCGLSAEEVAIMIKDNPASLLNLT